MYHPDNAPPYSLEFIARYRAAQKARNRRISVWAEALLASLPEDGPPGLDDLAFVVHGSAADLRFLDRAIDPSDRQVGVTLWGPPTLANYMPAGISRVTTCRSWLNQWSIDHSNGDSLRWLPEIDVPVLIIQGTDDRRVDLDHAHRMALMLELYDKKFELLEVEDGGHGFDRDGSIIVARVVRRFISPYLRPGEPFEVDPRVDRDRP